MTHIHLTGYKYLANQRQLNYEYISILDGSGLLLVGLQVAYDTRCTVTRYVSSGHRSLHRDVAVCIQPGSGIGLELQTHTDSADTLKTHKPPKM